MRARFSREKRVVADWSDNKKLPEEEQLAYSYKPLEYEEFNSSVETIRRLGVLQADGKIIVPEDGAQEDLFELFKRLLPKNVRSVGAPLLPNENDATQEPITLEEIATNSPFVALATELLATLIAVSAPTEADVKN